MQALQGQVQPAATGQERDSCDGADEAIQVVVQTVSADTSVEFNLNPKDKFSKLKELVAEQWHIPRKCQMLCHGSGSLNDVDTVASYCAGDVTSLVITLVVSLHAVLTDLKSSGRESRIDALKTFGALGLRGGEEAFAAVSSCLMDEDMQVRHTAVSALAKVAEPGDERASNSLIGFLNGDETDIDPDDVDFVMACAATPCSRASAIRSLRSCNNDMWQACDALSSQQWFPDRMEGVRVLGQLSPKGDPSAVMTLVGCLVDTEEQVRAAGVEALAQVAEKGDPHTIDAMIANLKNSESVQALCHIVEKGDQLIIAAVAARLVDEDWNVRLAAIEALSQLAEKGDQQTIAMVTDCLEDIDSAVQVSAVQALAQMAQKGDQNCILAVVGCLLNTDSCVQIASIKALTQLTERGDEPSIAAVAGCLKDNSCDVRVVAVTALNDMAATGDQQAIEALAGCLDEDMSLEVVLTAVEMLGQIAERGDEFAIAALTRRISREERRQHVQSILRAHFTLLQGRECSNTMISNLKAISAGTYAPQVQGAAERILAKLSC